MTPAQNVRKMRSEKRDATRTAKARKLSQTRRRQRQNKRARVVR